MPPPPVCFCLCPVPVNTAGRWVPDLGVSDPGRKAAGLSLPPPTPASLLAHQAKAWNPATSSDSPHTPASLSPHQAKAWNPVTSSDTCSTAEVLCRDAKQTAALGDEDGVLGFLGSQHCLAVPGKPQPSSAKASGPCVDSGLQAEPCGQRGVYPLCLCRLSSLLSMAACPTSRPPPEQGWLTHCGQLARCPEGPRGLRLQGCGRPQASV